MKLLVITDYYYGLKDTQDTGAPNGYNEYFENWVPEAVEDEGDLEDSNKNLPLYI